MNTKSYDPLRDAAEHVGEFCRDIESTLRTIRETEGRHTAWRTRRNERVLALLRAVEIFAGESVCPVCGSPPKWNPGKPPKDKQRQDLHDDQCELSIHIDHFESCLKEPGLW